jgi:hypothetical protein
MPLLSFAIGLASANIVEWFIHKYVLHGLGKKKGSFWSFHWADHHRASRKNSMYDPSYNEGFFHSSRIRENLGVMGLMLSQVPFFWVSPWYVIGTWAYSVAYLWCHRKSHLETAWGKKWMPWHATHHLGRDQDKNWGVVATWFDWVMGTRTKE